jgi:hypothetical protein
MPEWDIVVSKLSGLERERRYAVMYVGNLDNPNLVFELLELALREVAFPPAEPPEQPIVVSLEDNGTILLYRAGVQITKTLAGAMFEEPHSTFRRAGLQPYGKGAFATALSEMFVVELVRDGERFVKRFVAGVPQPSLTEPVAPGPDGLRILYKPDPNIIVHAVIDAASLSRFIAEVAGRLDVPVVFQM